MSINTSNGSVTSLASHDDKDLETVEFTEEDIKNLAREIRSAKRSEKNGKLKLGETAKRLLAQLA